MSESFFKIKRSKATEELIKNKNAWALLSLIAYRTRRTNEFNIDNLKPGEALIGDLEACGLTAQEYRTSKENLEKWGFAKFRTTNKGTIATLINSNIFDINIKNSNNQATSTFGTFSQKIEKNNKPGNKQSNNRATNQVTNTQNENNQINSDSYDSLQKLNNKPGNKQTTNQVTSKATIEQQTNNKQATTNKNVKNEKNVKNVSIPTHEKNLFLEFVFLSPAEFSSLSKKLGATSVNYYIEQLNNYIGKLGKDKYKSHYYTILSWAAKDKKEGKNKGKDDNSQNNDEEMLKILEKGLEKGLEKNGKRRG